MVLGSNNAVLITNKQVRIAKQDMQRSNLPPKGDFLGLLQIVE